MEFILFCVLLAMSAFFSGAESAFVNAQKAKAFVWHRQHRRFSKLYVRYIQNQDKYLVTVLVGNNFVNIALSTVGALLFVSKYGEDGSVLIVTALVLILSEITPKVIFSYFADSIILPLVPLIRFVEVFVKPLSIFAEWISSKLIKLEESEMNEVFSHHELDHIFNESKEKGVVELDEHKYIKNIFLLNNTRIKEIMIPRSEITAINVAMSIDEIYAVFKSSGYSRIPIYDETIDGILGIIFARDLLEKPSDIKSLIQEALFVPETKSCKELLLELQQGNKSLAIAIDEFGGVAGMVRIEQLIGVIVGPIAESTQLNIDRRIIKLAANKYKVSGRLEKETFAESLMLETPNGDFETVAGMLLDKLQRFPTKDDVIEFEGFEIRVLSSNEKQIDWLRVDIKDD